jgi:PPOX class probable F420-dependent enzyme
MIDWTSEFGRHADRRLRNDLVIWMTTVGDLWNGESFTIYSQTDTWKVRHLSRHPRVSLHLNSDEAGDDVVVLLGQAAILESGLAADQNEGYLEKYRQRIAGLGMSPEDFARDYCVVIRVTPSRLRGI